MEKKSTHKPILIAGPCSLEGYEMADRYSYQLGNLANKYGFEFVFKASFDKANRTSLYSKRGLGLEHAMLIFEKLRCKITTDIHEPWQAEKVAPYVDIIQIPAFLCRQTDLLVAAGETGSTVNIKKGQMVSGKSMIHAVEKIGHDDVLLTERGSMFGIDDLVVDMRQVQDMQKTVPVIMDCTHSTTPEYTACIARCGQALGVRGYFFEVHEDPSKAWSDGSKSIKINEFEDILKQIC